MAYISADNLTAQISTHSVAREWFHKDSDNHPDGHEIDDRLINCFEFLRTHFGYQLYPGSTVRVPGDPSYNSNSQHAIEKGGKAADFNWSVYNSVAIERDILIRLNYDIDNKGPVFRELIRRGARGFGLYDDFIHIDVRDDGSMNQNFEGISYAFWDNRQSIKFAVPANFPEIVNTNTGVVPPPLPPVEPEIVVTDTGVEMPIVTNDQPTDNAATQAAGYIVGTVEYLFNGNTDDGTRGMTGTTIVLVVLSVSIFAALSFLLVKISK